MLVSGGSLSLIEANAIHPIVGDFNMPVESAIYRRDWSEFRNAFSQAGVGFGMTRDNGWIQVRIDHILAGPSWRAKRVVVSPVGGVDHRPVIADLTWLGAQNDPNTHTPTESVQRLR